MVLENLQQRTTELMTGLEMLELQAMGFGLPVLASGLVSVELKHQFCIQTSNSQMVAFQLLTGKPQII
jgi:hypothetical protein